MNIEYIITREEYEKMKVVTYDQACEILTRVVKKSVEEALRVLPMVQAHITSQVSYLKKLSDNFYDANKDLNAHRPIVSQVIETLEASNPGISYEKVLKLAAPKARERILTLNKADQSPGPKRNLSLIDNRMKDLP